MTTRPMIYHSRQTTMRTRYFNLTELLHRGWSPNSIRAILGSPERTAFNPNSSSGKSYYFDAARVIREEERLNAAARTITVTLIDEVSLRANAYQYWLDTNENGGYINPCQGLARFSAFQDRISVNYIRHKLTRIGAIGYDAIPNSESFYLNKGTVKADVLNEIERVYPWLNVECERQRRMLAERPAYEDFTP